MVKIVPLATASNFNKNALPKLANSNVPKIEPHSPISPTKSEPDSEAEILWDKMTHIDINAASMTHSNDSSSKTSPVKVPLEENKENAGESASGDIYEAKLSTTNPLPKLSEDEEEEGHEEGEEGEDEDIEPSEGPKLRPRIPCEYVNKCYRYAPM